MLLVVNNVKLRHINVFHSFAQLAEISQGTTRSATLQEQLCCFDQVFIDRVVDRLCVHGDCAIVQQVVDVYLDCCDHVDV